VFPGGVTQLSSRPAADLEFLRAVWPPRIIQTWRPTGQRRFLSRRPQRYTVRSLYCSPICSRRLTPRERASVPAVSHRVGTFIGGSPRKAVHSGDIRLRVLPIAHPATARQPAGPVPRHRRPARADCSASEEPVPGTAWDCRPSLVNKIRVRSHGQVAPAPLLREVLACPCRGADALRLVPNAGIIRSMDLLISCRSFSWSNSARVASVFSPVLLPQHLPGVTLG